MNFVLSDGHSNGSNQAATQKAVDSDSMMSPELSPFVLHDSVEERRRSQALVGVADVETNLSEEKLLQVDMMDSGKVREEESWHVFRAYRSTVLTRNPFSMSHSPSTHSSLAPSPRGLGEAVKSPPSSTSV